MAIDSKTAIARLNYILQAMGSGKFLNTLVEKRNLIDAILEEFREKEPDLDAGGNIYYDKPAANGAVRIAEMQTPNQNRVAIVILACGDSASRLDWLVGIKDEKNNLRRWSSEWNPLESQAPYPYSKMLDDFPDAFEKILEGIKRLMDCEKSWHKKDLMMVEMLEKHIDDAAKA